MNFCTALNGDALLCNSLLIALAILVTLVLAWWESKRYGQHVYVPLAMLPYVLGGALIVGRLNYIWFPPPAVAASFTTEWYMSHWLDFQNGPLTVWRGGFDYGGMLLGGCVAGWLYLRLWQEKIDVWGDILIIPVLVGIGIGGWVDSTSPMFMLIPLWSLLAAGLIAVIRWRTKLLTQSGAGFSSGALMLLCGLLVAEFIRVDAARLPGGFSVMQIVASIGVIGCVSFLFGVWRNTKFTGNSD